MPRARILVWPGRLVDPFDLKPGDVDIWTIAHSLSQQCRYTGHPHRPYYTAEHCVVLSKAVPKHLRKIALLHEAEEPVVGDLNYPVKRCLPDFEELSTEIRYRVLADFFDCSRVELGIQLGELETYDRRVCVDEMRAMLPLPADYDPAEDLGEPLGVRIEGWSARKAERRFMDRYVELFS